jgi:hypothetical protein
MPAPTAAAAAPEAGSGHRAYANRTSRRRERAGSRRRRALRRSARRHASRSVIKYRWIFGKWEGGPFMENGEGRMG